MNWNSISKNKWARAALFLWFTGAVYWAAGALASRISVNRGDSVDPVVFWIERPPERIEQGDYVLFPLRYEKYRQGEEFTAVKRAACLPEDHLVVQSGWAWCKGKLLGPPALGRADFKFVGQVPRGKLFVMGDNQRSWDSRHWGLLDLNLIFARSRASF